MEPGTTYATLHDFFSQLGGKKYIREHDESCVGVSKGLCSRRAAGDANLINVYKPDDNDGTCIMKLRWFDQ